MAIPPQTSQRTRRLCLSPRNHRRQQRLQSQLPKQLQSLSSSRALQKQTQRLPPHLPLQVRTRLLQSHQPQPQSKRQLERAQPGQIRVLHLLQQAKPATQSLQQRPRPVPPRVQQSAQGMRWRRTRESALTQLRWRPQMPPRRSRRPTQTCSAWRQTMTTCCLSQLLRMHSRQSRASRAASARLRTPPPSRRKYRVCRRAH